MKLKYFKQKETFNTKLGEGDLQENDLCFIQSSKQIWTHNNYFGVDELELLNKINILIEDKINNIYPIGSIYIAMHNLNPKQILGLGNWEKIEDRFLLASGLQYSKIGETGGEFEHVLLLSETPLHTHTRGTMNITGGLSERPCSNSVEILNSGTTGGIYNNNNNAFISVMLGDTVQWKVPVQTNKDELTTHVNNLHTFDASRTWTGETSSVGENQPHNNTPPYIVVNIWKRIN